MLNDEAMLTTESIVKLAIGAKCLYFEGDVPYIKSMDCYERKGDKDAIWHLVHLITQNFGADAIAQIDSKVYTEVLNRLKLMKSLQIGLEKKFEQQKKVIRVENGVYDIERGVATATNNGNKFDYQYNFKYQRNSKRADAPCFDRFVKTSLGEQNYECFMRMLGYCLSSLTDAKKAFFLIGDGNTGKSTILDVVESICGKGIITHEPFEKIGTEQSRAKFRGSRLNISRETKRTKLRNEEAFKSLVSCEYITGRNLYESSFDFVPHMKLLVASNHPVEFHAPDEAIYDRMVIIFMHSTLKPDELDRNLKDKLLKEKDVIFSLALDKLKDLCTSGYDFKMADESLAFLELCKRQLRSDEDFFEEQCSADDEAKVGSSQLYGAYTTFCLKNSLDPLGRNTFLQRVLWTFPNARRTKVPNGKGGTVNGFVGLKLKGGDAV